MKASLGDLITESILGQQARDLAGSVVENDPHLAKLRELITVAEAAEWVA